MNSRRTKIVATLGPASGDEETLTKLIAAGVDVVRLNFSHGSHAQHADYIDLIRKVSEQIDRPVSLLQDLQGPKIRVGELVNSFIEIEDGKPLILTSKDVLGNKEVIPIDYPDLYHQVTVGDRILLDDGNLELLVTSIEGEDIKTQVMIGGVLKPHKGVNLPGSNLGIPALTEKDRKDLVFGLQMGVDAIALSFVRTGADVALLRKLIFDLNPEKRDIPIIAKLEKPSSLHNLDEIVDQADGVMVARGDLGVELSPEDVPIAQKRIISTANQHAKLVITATQMLDSMIHNPKPTRAEASDVANAIFDGTDAVMLSGETAIGSYPLQSVLTMDAIIRQAEPHLMEWGHWDGNLGIEAAGLISMGEVTHDDALSITRAAKELAHDRNVTAIAVFTQTGRTAHLMAKSRPSVPILAFTPSPLTFQRLPMFWGVVPRLVPFANSLEEMLSIVEKAILSFTQIKPGQQVVFISGFPVGALCPPNLALLHTIRNKKHAS
jgi:pyruvate kinase